MPLRQSMALPEDLLPRTAFWRRAMLLCVTAILCVLAAYVIVSYSFNAVVRCEVYIYRFQHQARTVLAELASTNACGF